MKRWIVCLCMLAVFLPLDARAEEKTYIVRLESPPISLYSDKGVEMKPVFEELNMYAIPESQLDSLSDVVYAVPTLPVELYDTESLNDKKFTSQWNLPMVGMLDAWRWRLTGAGVRIAVIDSGADVEHKDIKDRIVAKKNYTSNDAEDVTDNDCHGTSVAGIISAVSNNSYGVAGISQAELVILKMFDYGGDTDWLVQAIRDAVYEYDCDVINLSLGVTGGTEDERKPLKEAIQAATDAGVIVVAAVGNNTAEDHTNAIRYPAAYEGVIGVGSIDSAKNHVASSVVNETVDLCAPGKEVWTIYPNGKVASRSGTSFATPHVSAAAAIAKAMKPEMTSSEFEVLVTETASVLDDEAYDTTFGWGLLDIKAMTEALCKEQKISQFSRVFATEDGVYADFRNYSGEEITNGALLWKNDGKDGSNDKVSLDSAFTVPDGCTVRTPFAPTSKDAEIKVMLFESLTSLSPLCPFGYQE